jgi:hypothetical protein
MALLSEHMHQNLGIVPSENCRRPIAPRQGKMPSSLPKTLIANLLGGVK